jgi:hypothetical protein
MICHFRGSSRCIYRLCSLTEAGPLTGPFSLSARAGIAEFLSTRLSFRVVSFDPAQLFQATLIGRRRTRQSCSMDRLFIVCIAAGFAGGLCAAVLSGIWPY